MAHRLRLAARLGGLVALGGSRAHAMKTEDEPKQRRFVAGDAFKKLTSEPGEHGECPVWEPAPNVVQYSSTAGKAVERIDIEQVPGAFMLSNVLAPGECESLAALAEAMGFVDDAPLKLERNDLRRNTHCLMIADDTLWRPIWERCRHLFPAQQRSEGACGLNQRFRMYKYEAGGAFGPHRDSCWPGSAVVDGKHVGNAFDDRWSKMTFLLYLDAADGYEGGETTFLVPGRTKVEEGLSRGMSLEQMMADGAQIVKVKVPQGWALCFHHGAY